MVKDASILIVSSSDAVSMARMNSKLLSAGYESSVMLHDLEDLKFISTTDQKAARD